MQYIFLILFLVFTANAEYVGDNTCKTCHKKEHSLWQASHHDLSMQKASKNSVLGDFNTTFKYNDILTSFYKKDGKFMVRTDNAKGELQDFTISHTFGVYPLQQYLIPLENGHVQVLDIVWDSRPKEQGGQRWFHLHPNENVKGGDILHWSGPSLN